MAERISEASSRTLQDLLNRFAERGDSIAVIQRRDDGRESLTYGDLSRRSLALAGGLAQAGLAPGDRVAIFAHNSLDWVLCRFALVAAAAPCVPIDYDADAGRVARLLADSGAGRMFVSPSLLDVAKAALPDVGHEVEICLFDTPAGQAGQEHRALADFEAPEAGECLADSVPEDTASRFYTSGTTGPPKAVPLTHQNLTTNLDVLLQLKVAGPGDRILLPLPLHHSFPFLVGLLLPLALGATVVFPAGLTGPQVVEAMREERVTVIVGVPRLYDALVAAVDSRLRELGPVAGTIMRGLRSLSGALRRHLGVRAGRTLLAPLHRRLGPNLRLMASGGAKLNAATEWKLEALGYQVLTGYGLVETTSVATFNMPDQACVGSAGKPSNAVEMRIQPVEGVEHGEVQFRGPVVFAGYADNPDANAESFTEDGWFRTGDLGRLDDRGFLFIEGRLKEMIVLPDGKNVAPEEVEAIYRESPFAKDVAVLEHDDRLVGLVVPDIEALRAQGTSDTHTLLRVSFDELGQRMPRYMRVADFVVTREELPRNHLGKYRRHLLEEIYVRAERGGPAAPGEVSEADEKLLSGERARRLMNWLERRFPDRHVEPDTSLQMELGIDSLSWVDMSLELEHELGVTLSEAAVADVVTVRDLILVVEKSPARGEGQRPGDAAESQDQNRWLGTPGPGTRLAGALLYGLNRLLVRTYFRLRVEGVEHLPRHERFIIAANHVSDIDPVVLVGALPWRTARRIWWGGDRKRLFENAAGRALARVAHIFPVDDRAPKASLDLARRSLEKGHSLVWFPEEWRSPTGELQAFRAGIGVLVSDTQTPVVPCHIDGAFDAMPRTARWPRPRQVTVRFGPAVAASDLLSAQDGDQQTAYRQIAAKLHDRVADLVPRKEGGDA